MAGVYVGEIAKYRVSPHSEERMRMIALFICLREFFFRNYLEHSFFSPHPVSPAREASWRRAFDLCTPLLFDLYHYLEQNGYFGLVPENQILSDPGSVLVDGFDTHLIPWSFSCGLYPVSLYWAAQSAYICVFTSSMAGVIVSLLYWRVPELDVRQLSEGVSMTSSTENATPPRFTKSRNSRSSVQSVIHPHSDFDFVLRDTEKYDLVDFHNLTHRNHSTVQIQHEIVNFLDFHNLQAHSEFVLRRGYDE